MAITNFIPTVWSETLYKELDKQYVAVAHCNRDFDGDITEQGSVVKVCGVGDVQISTYTRNTDMSNPQTLSDTVYDLLINQTRYFNFQIDDVERAQASPKLMDAAMGAAASALANSVDRYVLSLCVDHENRIMCTPYVENILNIIIDAREKLYAGNVTDDTEVVLEVSPAVATMLYKAKLNLSTSNQESLENGCIGSIAGCKVFVTNNISTVDEGETEMHYCLMRTKRAIAYASQLSEIDAYRPEKRFADAVKGLLLFGAGIVYPKELVAVCLSLPKSE